MSAKTGATETTERVVPANSEARAEIGVAARSTPAARRRPPLFRQRPRYVRLRSADVSMPERRGLASRRLTPALIAGHVLLCRTQSGPAMLEQQQLPLARTCKPAGTGDSTRPRPATNRNSRPRFSEVGCKVRRSIQAFEAAGRGFEPLRAHHLLPRPATSVVEPAPRLAPGIGAAVS